MVAKIDYEELLRQMSEVEKAKTASTHPEIIPLVNLEDNAKQFVISNGWTDGLTNKMYEFAALFIHSHFEKLTQKLWRN